MRASLAALVAVAAACACATARGPGPGAPLVAVVVDLEDPKSEAALAPMVAAVSPHARVVDLSNEYRRSGRGILGHGVDDGHSWPPELSAIWQRDARRCGLDPPAADATEPCLHRLSRRVWRESVRAAGASSVLHAFQKDGALFLEAYDVDGDEAQVTPVHGDVGALALLLLAGNAPPPVERAPVVSPGSIEPLVYLLSVETDFAPLSVGSCGGHPIPAHLVIAPVDAAMSKRMSASWNRLSEDWRKGPDQRCTLRLGRGRSDRGETLVAALDCDGVATTEMDAPFNNREDLAPALFNQALFDRCH